MIFPYYPLKLVWKHSFMCCYIKCRFLLMCNSSLVIILFCMRNFYKNFSLFQNLKPGTVKCLACQRPRTHFFYTLLLCRAYGMPVIKKTACPVLCCVVQAWAHSSITSNPLIFHHHYFWYVLFHMFMFSLPFILIFYMKKRVTSLCILHL